MEKKKDRKVSHGFDGAGHMDAGHQARLLAMARMGRSSDIDAFVDGTETGDELAEEFAESAVKAMTGEPDPLGDDLAAVVEEEQGGPFVETSAQTEFASGTDESNIAEATREPFPTT